MPKKAPRFQLANRVVILTFFLSALIVGFYQLTTRGIGVAWMGFIAVLYLRGICKSRPTHRAQKRESMSTHHWSLTR